MGRVVAVDMDMIVAVDTPGVDMAAGWGMVVALKV